MASMAAGTDSKGSGCLSDLGTYIHWGFFLLRFQPSGKIITYLEHICYRKCAVIKDNDKKYFGRTSLLFLAV